MILKDLTVCLLTIHDPLYLGSPCGFFEHYCQVSKQVFPSLFLVTFVNSAFPLLTQKRSYQFVREF